MSSEQAQMEAFNESFQMKVRYKTMENQQDFRLRKKKYKGRNTASENPSFRRFKLLPVKEQQKRGGRCMDCGVPFCQNGSLLAGMTSDVHTIWCRRPMI